MRLARSFMPSPTTTTTLTAVHSRGLTVTVVSIYGQAANTHSLRFAPPTPFLCIHDIAGAQQMQGTGLGSTQIRDKYLCVCVPALRPRGPAEDRSLSQLETDHSVSSEY